MATNYGMAKIHNWAKVRDSDIARGYIYEVDIHNGYSKYPGGTNPRFKSIIEARKYCIQRNLNVGILNIKSNKLMGIVTSNVHLGDPKNPWHVEYVYEHAWEITNSYGSYKAIRNLNRDGTLSKSRGKKIVY